jgi:integrative and conjugative element protein (TIGR02256 family)
MLDLAAKALPNETGGILVGRYTKELDYAVVSEASAPPSDSRAGRTWFTRGVRGLRRLLSRLWKQRTYFLGEWHFHPHAAPDPSGVDLEQLGTIASSKDYQCAAPLLVIIGGDPNDTWTLRAFVLPPDKKLVELTEVAHLPTTA